MSLIIEGMKMPEYRDVFGDKRGCVYLLMLTVNKDGTASMQFNDVDGGFHRVKEIRTPHGRLIDADALMECRLEPNHYEELKDGYIPDYDLDSAPTIIEAEVSENGCI